MRYKDQRRGRGDTPAEDAERSKSIDNLNADRTDLLSVILNGLCANCLCALRVDPCLRALRSNALGLSGSAVYGSVDQQRGQHDHNYGGCPGDDVEGGFIYVFAHQLLLVDQKQHENQHEGQYRAVDHLRKHDDLHQGNSWYQNDGCPGGDERGIEPVKSRGFGKSVTDAGLET